MAIRSIDSYFSSLIDFSHNFFLLKTYTKVNTCSYTNIFQQYSDPHLHDSLPNFVYCKDATE